MRITKRSIMTGIERTWDLDVTEDHLDQWASGGLVQYVFPHLTQEEREFLMTGMTDEEWNQAFSEELGDPYIMPNAD